MRNDGIGKLNYCKCGDIAKTCTYRRDGTIDHQCDKCIEAEGKIVVIREKGTVTYRKKGIES